MQTPLESHCPVVLLWPPGFRTWYAHEGTIDVGPGFNEAGGGAFAPAAKAKDEEDDDDNEPKRCKRAGYGLGYTAFIVRVLQSAPLSVAR